MESEESAIRSCPLCQLTFPTGYPDDALIKHIDSHLENSKIWPFFFLFKIPLHFVFHLTFTPGWLYSFSLSFFQPSSGLMSLHDYLKELSWSNHRLLVCCHLQQCSTSQLYSSLLLTSWGETFLATDRSWWSSAEERTWAGMDPHVLCQMQAFFSCPGPVMPHSACMSHSGLCLIRTLKLLCSISLLGKMIYWLHKYLNI